MSADLLQAILVNTVATLIGVFVGALAALATDRHNTRVRKHRRARTLGRILAKELDENYEALRVARPAYATTPWGKSFYLNTSAWDSALASGDLPEILGYELTDRLAAQYGWLARIRYHVDLMTRLWMSPKEITGYEEIRTGFRQAILAAMEEALKGHDELRRHLTEERPERARRD